MHEYSFPHALRLLEASGELTRTDGDVAEASSACQEKALLLFSGDIPVLTNVYSSNRRLELLLGRSLHQTALLAAKFLETPSAPYFVHADSLYTRHDSLDCLPIKKLYAEDTSGSINMGCTLFASDGGCTSGLYRIQPLDGKSALIHCRQGSGLAKTLTNGSDIQVSIAVGTSAHLVYASAASLPENISGVNLAAYLHPSQMIFNRRFSHPVPEGTQIVIEGVVSADQKINGGRFRMYTGGLSEGGLFPVMHAEAVYTAENPVYQTAVTCTPPSESINLLKACAMMHSVRLGRIFHGASAVFDKDVFYGEADIFHGSDGIDIAEFLKNDYFFGRFRKLNLFQHK
jgi:UbiD family decarboxylase